LPSPEADFVEQAEQLCAFLRKQQRGDGSLACTDIPKEGKAVDNTRGLEPHAGLALYALMVSQRHQPAAWKPEARRTAVAYYRPRWQEHKCMVPVPWLSAACAEAFGQTRERAFGDFVQEMNDWLCGLQYAQLDTRHPLWLGGFMGWADGKPAQVAPQVHSSQY